MALILSIETSTKVCSVALHRDNKMLSLQEGFEANSHSETLLQFIENVFEEGKVDKSELDAIAVSKGPGSYTGLRIGVSTAKGLAYAMDIPIISVDTLDALALNAINRVKDNSEAKGLFCPMIDARRMEVYCKILSEELTEVETTEAKIIDEFSFSDCLNAGKLHFFGNGSDKCKGTISHQNAVFMEDVYTSAEQIGLLAKAKFEARQFEDTAYFEPYYLKEFMTKPSTKKLL